MRRVRLKRQFICESDESIISDVVDTSTEGVNSNIGKFGISKPACTDYLKWHPVKKMEMAGSPVLSASIVKLMLTVNIFYHRTNSDFL